MSGSKYFMGTTTAKGYVNFYENLIEQLDYVLYIEGAQTSIVSPLLKDIAKTFEERTDIEYIYNHIQKSELEGIVLTDLNAGIFDRSKMNVKRMKIPLLKESLLFFGDGYQKEGILEQQEKMIELQQQMETIHTKTIESFQGALTIHLEIEDLYKDYLDFDEANWETDRILMEIFQSNELNKPSQVKHRYLGAATPEGPIDFIMMLTDQMTRRIFLKGTSGSGKSTMLRKIARRSQERGFNCEIYHCGFDPASLDMVILPELNIAIFDATSPHAQETQRMGDEELNLSDLFMHQSLTKKEDEKVAILKGQYQSTMQEAKEHLQQLKEVQKQFEDIYRENLIPEFLNVMMEEMSEWVEEKL